MKKFIAAFSIHALLLVLTYFVLFLLATDPKYRTYVITNPQLWAFQNLVNISIPFYFGYFVTSRSFNKGKYRFLFIGLTIFFMIIPPLILNWYSLVHSSLWSIFNFTYIFSQLSIALFLGLGLRSIFDLVYQRNIQKKLEQQNLKTELALLRTQLNPHFLFNSLHNIDTLIKKDPDQASEQLLKLSDIMRYMLYDSNVDQIALQKEVEHIENFISLQELRLKDQSVIEFKKTGDFQSVNIAPMMLISFVENIFKHYKPNGVENKIIIRLEVLNGHLEFYCFNPYEVTDTNKDKTQGIGLDTVKRRLELIYPHKYSLKINDKNNTFEVDLKINLKND